MVKKTVDDEREPVDKELTPQSSWGRGLEYISNTESGFGLAVAMPPPEPVLRLHESEIIDIDSNNVIRWRTGHLEHVANLYKGNPAQTERDYADDVAVARAYSADAWEALIK